MWHHHRCLHLGFFGFDWREEMLLPHHLVQPCSLCHLWGFSCSSSGSCWTWSRWRRWPRTRWLCRVTSRPCSSTCVWCSSPGCWGSTTPWRRSRSWQWCGSWCWDTATAWSLVRKIWNADKTRLSPFWFYPSASLNCGSFYFFFFSVVYLKDKWGFSG